MKPFQYASLVPNHDEVVPEKRNEYRKALFITGILVDSRAAEAPSQHHLSPDIIANNNCQLASVASASLMLSAFPRIVNNICRSL